MILDHWMEKANSVNSEGAIPAHGLQNATGSPDDRKHREAVRGRHLQQSPDDDDTPSPSKVICLLQSLSKKHVQRHYGRSRKHAVERRSRMSDRNTAAVLKEF